MLVTFTTKAHADITMFGDVAIRLLELMGHSGTVPSALAPADVPEALRRLQAAVDSQRGSGQQWDLDDGDGDDAADVDADADADESDRVRVSLRHRALPLIELLEAAEREKAAVTWND